MKRIFLVIVASFAFWIYGCTQEVTTYIPWKNKINSLSRAPDGEIPILLNGVNYRIVRIFNDGKSPIILNKISDNFNNVHLDYFYLPMMFNYRRQNILDVILPITKISINPQQSGYFLVRYTGRLPGSNNGTITFTFDGADDLMVSSKVYVGQHNFIPKLNLNVWAYFNYDLINGLKSKVLNDLQQHGVDVLVIPPYRLPNLKNPTKKDEKKLSDYLSNTQGRFKYYLLFLNLRIYNNSQYVLSRQWKEDFIKWLNIVKSQFKNSDIDFNKVLIYPFDEPNLKESKTLINIKKWTNSIGLRIPIYSTIGNKESMDLVNYLDIVQINTKNNLVNTIKNHKATIWEYEIKAQSRNVSPVNYLDFAWRCFRDGAKGMGIWNYADVSKSFSTNSLSKVLSLNSTKGSWELQSINDRDYSCIYRKGSNLYSSLRWEAISMGQQDYIFLLLANSFFGSLKANLIVKQLVSSQLSLNKWEQMKLSLLKAQ